MNFLIFLLPLGGALAARLLYQHWRAWLVWGIASLVTFLVTWLGGFFSTSQTITGIAIASGLGFLSPELWQGTRQATVALLSRPRNWLYAAGLFLFVYSLWHPKLLEAILTLAIMLFGVWVLFRGFKSGRSRPNK